MRNSRVIVGDSILRNVRYVNDCNVYALSGIRLEELNKFLSNNKSIITKARSILIHCGTNNIVSDSEPTIIDKFKIILTTLTNYNKDAHIMISTILARPLDHNKYGPKCASINRRLRELSKVDNFSVVMSHKITLKAGKPITDMFYDGLHLNQPAVKKLRQYLSQRLAEYGSKPESIISGKTYYLRRCEWSQMSD
jgi:hypothetical protein